MVRLKVVAKSYSGKFASQANLVRQGEADREDLRLPLSLRDVDVRPRYVSGVDDIVGDFIVPCLSVSMMYMRTSGYFSSAVLAISWRGLRALHENCGSVRVVCSPILAALDVSALTKAVGAASNEDQLEALLDDFRQMLASPAVSDSARALAALVASGFLEIRIAVPTSDVDANPARRIFHQKTGIFRDSGGDAVAFNGSMNETAAGLSRRGNVESFQAFASWQDDREATRVALEVRDFEDLWSDRFVGVSVQKLPDAVRNEILASCGDIDMQRALDELANREIRTDGGDIQGFRLRPHQAQVLASWAGASYRGIVKHATGSGKTITAIEGVRRSIEHCSAVLILVPSVLLQSQWEEELSRWGPPNARILLCGGGQERWKRTGEIEAWTAPGHELRIVIAVLATASKREFLDRIRFGDHLMVVADEVHRTGAASFRSVFSIEAGRVLGLSATPERAGDPTGSEEIQAYFGGVLEPEYGLQDAIRDGVLTPYYYSPSVVELTDSEQIEWDDFSAKIAQLVARDDLSMGQQTRLEQLLIKRARVAKQASNKAPEALDVLKSEYVPGQRWLVYCDTADQMHQVNELFRSEGVDSNVYYSDMGPAKKPTLAYFEAIGGVLVSIRCLDEGVDIPAASHALILASSRNPREFIQRRGRVLRRFPGKYQSRIYDVLVAPSRTRGPTHKESLGPLVGDIARAVEFADNASNRQVKIRLQAIAISYGMSMDELRRIGFEVDRDEVDDA